MMVMMLFHCLYRYCHHDHLHHTLYSYSLTANIYVELFRHHNWKRCVLVRLTSSITGWDYLADHLVKVFEDNDIKIAATYRVNQSQPVEGARGIRSVFRQIIYTGRSKLKYVMPHWKCDAQPAMHFKGFPIPIYVIIH